MSCLWINESFKAARKGGPSISSAVHLWPAALGLTLFAQKAGRHTFLRPLQKKKKNIEQKIKKDLQEAWKQVTAEHLFSASPSLSQAVSQRAKRLWTCKYFVRVWLCKGFFIYLFFLFGKVAQHCFFVRREYKSCCWTWISCYLVDLHDKSFVFFLTQVYEHTVMGLLSWVIFMAVPLKCFGCAIKKALQRKHEN